MTLSAGRVSSTRVTVEGLPGTDRHGVCRAGLCRASCRASLCVSWRRRRCAPRQRHWARRLRPRLLAAAGADAAATCAPLPYAIAYKSRLPEARARTGAAEPGAATAQRLSGIADGTMAATAAMAHGAEGENAGRSSEPGVAARGAPPPGAAASAGTCAASAEPAGARECDGDVPTAPRVSEAAGVGQAAEKAEVGGCRAVDVQPKTARKPDQATGARRGAGRIGGRACGRDCRGARDARRPQKPPGAARPTCPAAGVAICRRLLAQGSTTSAMFEPCFYQLPRCSTALANHTGICASEPVQADRQTQGMPPEHGFIPNCTHACIHSKIPSVLLVHISPGRTRVRWVCFLC